MVRVYHFPNDYAGVGSFVAQLLESHANFLEPVVNDELSLALRELLLNAVEHGNLGISFWEKSQALANGTWKSLVSSRQCAPPYRDRETHVTARWQPERVTFEVRDEGPGFDWRALPDPTDPDNLLCDHGRGVLMARLSVDSLTYDEKGNTATIVKTLRRATR